MTVARSLALCSLLFLVTAHVSGRQDVPDAPGPPAAPAGDVERGRYLVEQVAMCGECHSTRDARGEVVPGLRFRGGPMPVAPPSWAAENWPLLIPRIAGLPGYDEAQAIRLLTEGSIGRDGQQLRAPMPRFRLTRQDAEAVVAYLRTQ